MKQIKQGRISLDCLMLGRVLCCRWSGLSLALIALEKSAQAMKRRKQLREKEFVRVSRAKRIQKKLRSYFVMIGNTAIDRTRLDGA